MNALTAFEQKWLTAAEIASLVVSLQVPGLPITKKGILDLAKRENWNDQPRSLVRPRQGSKGGGGLEYHLTLLPERLQIKLMEQRARSSQLTLHQSDQEREKQHLANLRAALLPPRLRLVMQARAEVLSSIEGYQYSHGQDRAWAIEAFLKAQDDFLYRQEIEAAVYRGEILTAARTEALQRPVLLTAQTGFALDPAVLVSALNRTTGRGKIGRTAIYDWFKVRGEQGVAGLAPKPNKVDQPIPADFANFLKHWARPTKPSIPDAHAEYLKASADPSKALTLTQVEYIVSRKLNNIQKNIGREGILTLRSRLPYISRDTDDMWPTTVYIADGKTFDAEVADAVSGRAMRPEITSILDVATRKCVGVAISRKENVIAVTEALRKAATSHGIPAIFYTDRGAGYKNKTFDGEKAVDEAVGGLMARLGISKMHALPYNSQAKGIIERFNGQWNRLAKTFATYIGEDMDKEAKQKVHKLTRQELRTVGHSRMLPGWDEFLARVDAFVAEYNDNEHTGLPKIEDPITGKRRHMTPNEAWAAHVANGWQPITVDPAEADDLFRPYVIRKVSRGLVQWNTNEYFHIDLSAYHDREVMVGYDLHQADKVWVREFDRETQLPGKLVCVAEFGGNRRRFTPLTLDQAAMEKRAKGKLNRLEVHREAALEELRAPLLEHQPTIPMPEFSGPLELTVVPSEAPAASEALGAETPPPAPPRRIIQTDAELAQLVIENPEELTPGRARILREAMGFGPSRELLKLSGVDLAALDRVLWSAA